MRRETNSPKAKPRIPQALPVVVYFKKYCLFFCIFLLAGFLRLYRLPDYMEFLGDQGRDVVIVYQFLTKGDLMFIGPQTSIGNMYLGPWYYYLMAPFLLLAGFNPIGPAIMVIFFNLATVWLIWKVAREWFDETTGLIAALLFTLSPVIIRYSTFSWNPNIMPFFSLLSVWLIWQIWQNSEYKKLPLLAISSAMVLNSHYLGILLFPVIGFFWLLGFLKTRQNKELKRSYILYSAFYILIFFALMAPLLLFDLKHNFANFNAFKQFFSVRQTTVSLKFYKGILKVFELANQLGANFIINKDSWKFSSLFLLSFLLPIIKLRKYPGFWLLSTFLLVGLLGLGNYKQHIYSHYFGFLWPVLVLLVAASFRQLLPFSSILLGIIVWFMISNWHGFSPPNNQLWRTQKIANHIQEESGDNQFALALIAERNYDPPYRYFLQIRKAPLVDLHREVPNQLFVICEPWGKVDCNPIGHPLWEIAAFGWAKIDQQWEIDGIKIFKLSHYEQ